MSDNLKFDISIIQRPFKTEEGEEVIRNCLELETQGVNLELILDPGVSTELHKKAVENFITRLNSYENIKVTDYSKEMENNSEKSDE